MNQNSKKIKSLNAGKIETLDWLASILCGIGIWILYGGLQTIPPILIWPSTLVVIFGVFRFIFEGFSILTGKKNPVTALLIPLTLAAGTAALLILSEHFIRYLNFPYPLDDGEGFCLNQAIRLAEGQPLYPTIGPAPYIVTNYPPVFAGILSIFTDPDNVSFFAGRFISVISTILIALASGSTVGRITGNRNAGWVTGFLVLSSPVIYFWGALLRVDILSAMFEIAAIWVAISARGKTIFWTVPLLVLAIFTRQSSVEAIFAIGAGLLLFRDDDPIATGSKVKSGLIIIFGWIICIALALIFLQAWSGGEFWRHTVIYTKTQFYPERILTALQWIIPSHALILILALFGLRYALSDNRKRIIGLYFIASLATAMLSGKVGSDLNYFINLIIASACLAGVTASNLLQALEVDLKKHGWIAAILLLVPAAIIQSGTMEGNRAYSFTPIKDDYIAGQQIVDKLSSVNGPILSEDEGFCLLSGHEVLFNPFIMSEMAREGFWDETPFVDSIRNGEFDLIMLRFDVNDPHNDDQPGTGGHAGWDRFTNRMEAAIMENYDIDRSFSQIPDAYVPVFMRRYWYVYRPKSDANMEIQEEPGLQDLFGEGAN
ncbi:MAG: glycosyltransferase family 39 protein [bacterium]|nr:glycosyltransferase family 39 protein [bacterium]